MVAGGGEGHGTSFLGLAIYLILVIAILFYLMHSAKLGLGEKVFKNKWTQRFEQLFLFIQNLCVGIIGPHGRKYVPMIMVLWMMIFVGNVVALFMPTSTTADLSFNLAMALLAVGYVQYEGIKANGLMGHLSHFAGPKLPLAMIPITIMIFVIEIVSELMKNVSLSLRLFGNIHGGHEAVEAMNKLGGEWVPIGAFLLPIKILTCVVQALIFSLLTCVYLSLVTHHHEDHDEEHAASAPHGDAVPAPAH
jgi:F-type H+-transporting ATPase subunit a